ncbi:class II aldolase/adducin N-terminal [Scheffersomyces amazonensis]|uniref:class II aldolase/adducin N-terminal n=1 Tax=Scheffersomyces amazonensis TaxID=1078765 RepID=UPI00315D64A7
MAPSETKVDTTTTISDVQPTTSKGYAVGQRGSHNIAKGGQHPYPLPKFTDKYAEREWILQHMAAAFRVFARKGYSEGTAGHISVRDPVDPTTFWINPLGKHFGLMKKSDFVHVNEAGEILPDGSQIAINAAGFAIHSAIHQARPNVNAACHAHSVYGKAWSAIGRELDMINQDVCTFYKSHSVYNDFGGVALELEEGKHIAKALGNGKGVILRNHGLLTVGETVDEAAYLFTLLERSCETQILAESALRPGEQLLVAGEEEAAYTEHQAGDSETLYTEFQPEYDMEVYLNDDFLN